MARADAPRMIAVLGAESTGKTTLCAALARQLGGLWVPEALRDFCAIHRRTPQAHEQPAIARAQIEREMQARQQARRLGLAWVLCDTAPLHTAIYSRLLFGDATLFDLALAHHRRQYALSLLLEPDLPWVADPGQRDGPHMQTPVHAALLDTLDAYVLPHCRIGGLDRSARLTAAAEAVIATADRAPPGHPKAQNRM